MSIKLAVKLDVQLSYKEFSALVDKQATAIAFPAVARQCKRFANHTNRLFPSGSFYRPLRRRVVKSRMIR